MNEQEYREYLGRMYILVNNFRNYVGEVVLNDDYQSHFSQLLKDDFHHKF